MMIQQFGPAQIFTDNMVLQRDCPIPLWGKAADGSRVKVEFCGRTYKTEAVDGKWRIQLSPMNAGGPFDMKIQCGACVMTLRNILIGEVWVAGGQSNMQFPLIESLHGAEEAADADDEGIRYYDVPKIEYEGDGVGPECLPLAAWQLCTAQNAAAFSAVAFHYAKKLRQALNVSIGIIGCNMGATSASCWMSEEALSSDEEIRVYLDEYYAHLNEHDDNAYKRELEDFNRQIEAYQRKVEAFKATHPGAGEAEVNQQVGPCPGPPPMGKKSFMRPTGLYHTMLKKITPYAIRGVIFYQGEGDTHKPELYKKLFGKMMQNWRDDWQLPGLPFLFVQLAFYACDIKPEGETWAVLREQQRLTCCEDPHASMAVITDCGEKDNIHPVDKKSVGERLALLARAKIYGHDVEYSGPVFREMKVDGSKAVLHFDHAGNGLTARNGALKGFEICGKDGRYVEAKAAIGGISVEVSADCISVPFAVRYGWANYAEINLYNEEGLPAGPFRTTASEC